MLATQELKRVYGKLPLHLRDRLRWMRFPRDHAAVAWLWRKSGGKVMSGPFAGMKWRKGNPHRAYILGTQEIELHPTIEGMIMEGFPDLVNVGAADGYYAVGFALRCPGMRVLAFEQEAEHQAELDEVATTNGVRARLTIAGYCGPAELESALATRPDALVLVDIEGGEIDLLDPSLVPSLRSVTVLIETHDGLRAGCEAAMRERFAASHRIETIGTRERTMADLPKSLAGVPWPIGPSRLRAYMQENRKIHQTWLICRPIK